MSFVPRVVSKPVRREPSVLELSRNKTLLKGSDEFRQCVACRVAPLAELDEVDPTVATLPFADKRLTDPQLLGHLGLGQRRRLPPLPEQGHQQSVLAGERGFFHRTAA